MGRPDEGDRSFFEKWRDQLADQPPDVHRIAADVLAFYHLFPDQISAETKLSQVEEVASWKLADEPNELEVVRRAYSVGGIGGSGIAYNTQRWLQIAFYLKFAESLKRQSLNSSDLADCVEAAEAAQRELPQRASTARHALLHLLFPDHFERIASQAHKEQIVQAFARLAGGATDIDESLRNVRRGLVAETGRPDLDFYDSDIEDRWRAPRKGAGKATPASGGAWPRCWIEETLVRGRSDRTSGEYALGRALWSPQRDRRKADTYRFMRDVQPGDIVLHLTDNRAFTGTSRAAAGHEEFNGVPDTEWGAGPSYLVRLRDYRVLDPPLDREVFFGAPFRERLVRLAKSGQKNLFYNRHGSLNQGAYLTPVPAELLGILNDAYVSVGGRALTDRRSAILEGATWCVYISAASRDNLQIALREGVWGVKNRGWLEGMKEGDAVILALNITSDRTPPPKGFPRVDLQDYRGNAERFIQGQITSRPFENHEALWPDDTYPYRFRWESTVEQQGNPVNTETLPVTVVDAIRLSAVSQGRPVRVGQMPAAVATTESDLNRPYSLEECAAETGFDVERLAAWVRAIERKGQAILYGPPGTGKTFLAEKLASHLIGGARGFRELVQFHPSYGYEDFIQGIRPVTDEDGELRYEVTPGRFLNFCEEASHRDGTCVLIVDEINRANLSRVFGELMYLLEYRGRQAPLAGGGILSIPANVRMIGTMNTADRSIALVDHALRRRFAFLALQPDYSILRRYHEREETGFEIAPLIEVLKVVNRQIDDRNYQVGITFFLRNDLREQIEDIWRMEIEPYLEEYFFDQSEKVADLRWDQIGAKILRGN